MLIGKSLGRYRIIERLGRGGMASVYKALDPSFPRDVAIKVLSPDLVSDPRFRERFQIEMRTLARLDHPNIAQVHDSGDEGDYFYMVLQFFPEGDLRARMNRGISVPQALRVLRDVAAALGAAHKVGIVHRDLKPGNILMATDGRAVLADFGIAKLKAGSFSTHGLTTSGMVVGTPQYMAPEQIKGEQVDARSDVYAFGILAYEMLVGQPPYTGENLQAVSYKILNEPFPKPRAQRPELSADVEGLILKCTAMDTEERFADGTAVLAALKKIPLAGTERVTGDVTKTVREQVARERASKPKKPKTERQTPVPTRPIAAPRAAKARRPRRAGAAAPRRRFLLIGLAALAGAAAIGLAAVVLPRWLGIGGPRPPSPRVDTVPPAAASLRLGTVTESEIELLWAAPGGDGMAGWAATYGLRYSRNEFGETAWDALVAVPGVPSPGPAGTVERFAVTGLDAESDYWFVLRTADSAGNWSRASNVVRATTAKRPMRFATLVVNTVPARARVSIDGRSTPGPRAVFDSLDAGEHTIRAESDGYTPLERIVALRAGETREESVALRVIPGPKPGGDSVPPPPPATGTLEVTTNLPASVFVDGELRASGTTRARLSLPPGLHDVRAEHPDSPPKSWDDVEVLAGTVVRLSHDFAQPDAGKGSIVVRSRDIWVQVLLDGVDQGQSTPCILLDVPAGKHIVSVTRQGFVVDGGPISVTVKPGEQAEVDFSGRIRQQ